ncbi:P-loop containing nucleoside triphosphate hydrolase protein [Sphaerosporella brunnea]|uniref:P-loop containing nucleoside triphosphate hydrolase protein n=1 Tax=Sphaerosporella brunnea TaxID=1250544 RepID=A0A5J5EED9_9PEZI|nr:P-loop containing nucleoside triphosphate hydrolase protein [Sphaerosporella brunnea]
MDSAPQTAPPAVEAGKEIIIALMGVTGAGKSYFIRKISGLSEVEVGDGLESCTATIKPYSFTYEGTKITLVDTPGFNDTHRSDTDVLKDIVAWTSQTYKEKRLLSGIIYLHRITDVRMEGSALKNLRMFKSLCGEDALHNVLLTTTQWSRVDPREGEARELELKTKKEFWKPLLDRGATLARFYGDRGSGLELIHKLMAREPKVLDIQEQIVDKKMDLIDTSAGQTINEELIRLQKKYAEELKSTKQELQAALESKDEELKEMLAEQQDREERRLAKIEAERKELLAKHETEIKKRDEEMRKRDEESRKELKELYAAQQKREEALRAESAKKDEERKKLDDEYRRQLWDAQQKRDEAYRAEAARKEEHYKWQMEEQRRQNEADRRERMEIAKSISNEQHRAGLLEQQLQSERERRAQLEMQALETRNRLTMLERRPRGFRDVLFGR